MGVVVSSIRKATTYAAEKVLDLTREVLPPIFQYVVEHPIRTFGHIASAAALIAPAIVTAPIMAIAGFTGGGIAAGSIAAGLQSTIGNVAAGSVFATLQSAALRISSMVFQFLLILVQMGGYGSAAVAGIVRGVALAAEGINALRGSG